MLMNARNTSPCCRVSNEQSMALLYWRTVWSDLYMWSQVVERSRRRNVEKKKKNSISLVFSFKVQVRLDSQSSEAERLKEILKMPSAWSVTCLRKFSPLWLVWLCEMIFSFLFSLPSSYVSLCFSVISAVLWIKMIITYFCAFMTCGEHQVWFSRWHAIKNERLIKRMTPFLCHLKSSNF